MEKIFIIDGNSYIYRAFHAIRGLKNRDGFPTNAIYGFTTMLIKIIQEQPDFVFVVFDAGKTTFRNQIFDQYKAHRPPMPDDLVVQLPFIKSIVSAFNLKSLQLDNYEADDIIASITKRYKGKYSISIITSDKDLTQLIEDGIIIIDTMKDINLDTSNIDDKFGVKREFIIDYLSLVGDSSDNIPGVKGIGPKGAVKLINEFGSIENIYKSLDLIPDKTKNLLLESKESAFISKTLITLKDDIDIDFNLDDFRLQAPDTEKLQQIFTQMDFSSLLKKFKIDPPQELFQYKFTNSFPQSKNISGIIENFKDGLFEEFMGAFTEDGRSVFISQKGDDFTKISTSNFITFDSKHHIKIFEKLNIPFPQNFEDIQLLAYIYDPEEKNTVEHLSYLYTNKFIKPIEDYKDKKNRKIEFSMLSIDDRKVFLSERSCFLHHCWEKLSSNINPTLKNIYEKIEKPLITVLHKMEKRGISINREILEEIDKVISADINSLTQEIYNITGKDFNINSPSQIAQILFEDLKLPTIKKTKTGHSTDIEVLEQLALIHPLPYLLLSYRELSKVKSTYIEGLQKAIDPKSGKIFPTFNQTITATGRLSCTNPNIQNIPVRGKYGDKIREAFTASEGHLLVSLDYSQIELRLMAHFSKDIELINAFHNNIDIHKLTASKIYKKDLEEIDNHMRNDGKTVNFSIIYGISPFGLAKSLKVDRTKAKIFIENYFNEYSGVKNFIETYPDIAKDKGFVETLFGRRRFVKGLNSKNHQEREFAKRIAINTPIQGSSADIIKIAMIGIDKFLDEFNSHMIMQIHDELIFEVPEIAADQFIARAKSIMENVCSNIEVPLKVDSGIGKNWFEAHK